MDLNILVIDDEWNMRNLLRIVLSKEGFEVTEAHNGTEGLTLFTNNKFDVVLLDIMMPDMDGWQVCEKIRQSSTTPIIMLTARSDIKDKVQGFETGADDYVVKPVDPEELIARIYALVRRADQAASAIKRERKIEFLDLVIYPERLQVVVKNLPVELTHKEYDIVMILAQNPQRTFSRASIVEQLWGNDFFGDPRVVDTHIKNIRDKFQVAGLSYNPIQTVWGVGYRWVD
ncbi:response regulator transcription factor [Paenibacillus sp. P96]|uniref:Response regulator transcription factor n=1 Tax=Paenibacillus zeirhizosphaerae TaxID=2987519 RepID=A0ABT9FVN8_9BACL|nr:response regulator transcription factor [Paenibacillus sp. P96]MDP4098576.1 response regulator transcription factor [Paenibacillus sp. P96]